MPLNAPPLPFLPLYLQLSFHMSLSLGQGLLSPWALPSSLFLLQRLAGRLLPFCFFTQRLSVITAQSINDLTTRKNSKIMDESTTYLQRHGVGETHSHAPLNKGSHSEECVVRWLHLYMNISEFNYRRGRQLDMSRARAMVRCRRSRGWNALGA